MKAYLNLSKGICLVTSPHMKTPYQHLGLYNRILKELERPLLALTLEATQGNQLRAADLLGLNRNTLRKKLKELEIPVVKGIK